MKIGRNLSFLAASALLLPAGLLAQATLTSAGSLPHFATGGGWRTDWFIVNPVDNANAAFQLNFIGDNGMPATIPLTNAVTGAVLPSASTYSATVPPHSIVVIRSDSTASSATSGWVQVSTDSSTTTVLETFQYTSLPANGITNVQQGGTTTQPAAWNTYLLTFNELTPNFAAIAIANLATNSISPLVTVRDFSGKTLGTFNLPLGPLEHKAFVLDQEFPLAKGVFGSVTFETGQPGLISVLGLNFNGTNDAFSSVLAIGFNSVN
jgi:hypothetical protein